MSGVKTINDALYLATLVLDKELHDDSTIGEKYPYLCARQMIEDLMSSGGCPRCEGMQIIYNAYPLPIKGCPYCGDGERFSDTFFEMLQDKISYCVFCHSCYAKGPDALTPEKAISEWNRIYDMVAAHRSNNNVVSD